MFSARRRTGICRSSPLGGIPLPRVVERRKGYRNDRCVRVDHAAGLQSAIGSIRRSGAAPDECSIGRYAERFE
jgi:hypothetical protein